MNAETTGKPTLTILTALLAPPVLLNAADTLNPTRKPSFVFIFADDWGWGDLSCHASVKRCQEPFYDVFS